MSNTWCPEVYRGIYIDRVNDDRIRVAPCCNADWKEELVDTFNFDTSPALTEIRKQFDLGNKPSECRRCWQVEDLGYKSRRKSAIEFYGIDYGDTTIKLESIDHSATWACNLACVMCGPHFSSTWAKELDLNADDLLLLGRKFQKSNNFLDRLNFENVKKVHFNGGEPLLNNDQTDLLERLEQAGALENTFISYNTNGTQWPSDRIFELWSRARLVKLFFSVDATGKGFDYVRHPARWEQVAENLLKLRKQAPSNVMFGFNVSVGTYNIFEVLDVWYWFDRHLRTNREGDPSDFCWQLVYNFDIKNLNPEAKQDAMLQLSYSSDLHGIINYLESSINYKHSDDWIVKLDEIDQRRGTNWRETMCVGKYY